MSVFHSPHFHPTSLFWSLEEAGATLGQSLGTSHCPSCLPALVPASLQFYSNLGN